MWSPKRKAAWKAGAVVAAWRLWFCGTVVGPFAVWLYE